LSLPVELLAQRPSLARGTRLRFDRHAGGYVLLAPERCLTLNASAARILEQCDGQRSVAQIVAALLTCHEAEPDLALHTAELLLQLKQRGLLVLSSPT
jgi:pyrroloquinoline quinone biosynthesis protein D